MTDDIVSTLRRLAEHAEFYESTPTVLTVGARGDGAVGLTLDVDIDRIETAGLETIAIWGRGDDGNRVVIEATPDDTGQVRLFGDPTDYDIRLVSVDGGGAPEEMVEALDTDGSVLGFVDSLDISTALSWSTS